MGLDLYAGPLTRYFAGDWETIVQKASREAGIEARIIYASGEPHWVSRAEAPELAAEFMKFLDESLDGEITQSCDWPEGFDLEYDTDKPDHTGRSALQLMCAYLERPDLVRPKTFHNDIDEDPAVNEAVEKDYYFKLMSTLECQMYLPVDGDFIGPITDVFGADRVITPVHKLLSALEELNSRAWSADDATITKWRERGPLELSDQTLQLKKSWLPWRRAKLIDVEPAEVADEVEHEAQFAFSIYWRLACFAAENRCPILTDE